MYYLQGLTDSDKFYIKDNTPYFYNEGDSYYAKLMNNLSLEDKIANDNMHNLLLKIERLNNKPKSSDISIKIFKQLNYDDESCDYNVVKERKSKSICKIRRQKQKNKKKNKIRQEGYFQKIFYQNEYTTIKPNELISKLDIEIENFVQECEPHDTNDDSYSCYSYQSYDSCERTEAKIDRFLSKRQFKDDYY